MLLGCIADDFTGATDLANTLVKEGMHVVQSIGVPATKGGMGDVDAVVVALKSRTTPAAEAVADSLAALEWLKAEGARQFLFKYCSTFDSTDAGNIGPVSDALMDALGAEIVVACPAFPVNGRTIYKGHLFVGDVLLNECGMESHPLTPMTDANLVRVLGRQTRRPVGLVPWGAVAKGADAIRATLAELAGKGARHAIVDAVADADLRAIGEAAADHKLISGGSGIALGLPENFRRQGLLGSRPAPSLPTVGGRAVVIAGSCSNMTRAQVARAEKIWPTRVVDPRELAAGHGVVEDTLAWAAGLDGKTPVLIYSSADPAAVRGVQDELGRESAGAMIEHAMGRIAKGLLDQGVGRLVVAGGETSGAVVNALGIYALRIGPEIDPGVPWTDAVGGAVGGKPLALALKSGNFGGEDFFEKALGMLA